ncbi:MAG: J domain-containing protein [Deltaproteobacteria bacterium]|nr:J domain-containing protein [Deltaproteobacteria bacterium]
MNQKTALKILGLKPGVSLAQAKKTFRDLAKKYHPDRYPQDLSNQDMSNENLSKQDLPFPGQSVVDEIRDVDAEARKNRADRTDRMKQINQAFHFLVPLLVSSSSAPHKESTGIPSSFRKKKVKTDPWFRDIFKILKREIKLKVSKKRGTRTSSSVKQPLKPKAQRVNRTGQAVRFATILNTLNPGALVDKKSRKKSKKKGRVFRAHPRGARTQPLDLQIHPYDNFMTYMALKKTMNARIRSEQNHDRIEKIGPVTRVNPIGSKANS